MRSTIHFFAAIFCLLPMAAQAQPEFFCLNAPTKIDAKNTAAWQQYQRGSVMAFSKTQDERDNAIALLAKASDGGIKEAGFVLGFLYSDEVFALKDHAKAVKYYQKSARADCRDAQVGLALAYEQGKGVKSHLSKAFTLYRQAAANGDVYAQQKTALYYALDEKRKNRTVLSYCWYLKSNGPSRLMLDTPRQNQIVTDVISLLDDKQKSLAQTLAAMTPPCPDPVPQAAQ